MTREHKLALILGFALVLVVGIAISDHFSRARVNRVGGELVPGGPTYGATIEELDAPLGTRPGDAKRADTPVFDRSLVGAVRVPVKDSKPLVIDMNGGSKIAAKPQEKPEPRAVMPSAPVPDEGARATKPVSSGKMKQYVVKQGDTLYRIAAASYKDGKLWRELAMFNKGKVSDEGGVLQGVTLQIPPKDVLLGEAVLGPAKAGESDRKRASEAPERAVARNGDAKGSRTKEKAPKYSTYTVQPGDELSGIAQKLLGKSTRWQELWDLNSDVLADADTLPRGVMLKIPAR